MLKITIPAKEMFDEETSSFFTTKEQTLQLEHSLVSISKWESKWNKPFLSQQEKTLEETTDYVRCMTITQNVDPDVYNYLTKMNITEIDKYIEAPMTATTFPDNKKTGIKEVITSELIYYWMIAHNIPMECQKWHLNKLLTLIRVCDAKNAPSKKMSKKDVARQYADLNAIRRAKLNSKG